MNQRFDALAGARDRIVNMALIAVVTLGFVAFSASLLRSMSIGWQPAMALQIVLWAIVAGAAGFRHRLPFLVRAWILIGMLLVVFLSGLVAFGLIGLSVPGLLMTTVLVTLLFGSRVGWAIGGVSLAMIAAVEDDVHLRDVVEAMLEDLGYVVIVAGNGREALEVLSTEPRVDLLLTDVVMPGGISGPALAEAARRDRAELKILYMSGYAENAIVHNGRLDAGVRLLAKPFTIADLGRKLRAVLDG